MTFDYKTTDISCYRCCSERAGSRASREARAGMSRSGNYAKVGDAAFNKMEKVAAGMAITQETDRGRYRARRSICFKIRVLRDSRFHHVKAFSGSGRLRRLRIRLSVHFRVCSAMQFPFGLSIRKCSCCVASSVASSVACCHVLGI